jgi:hypothetical protein
MKRLLFLLLFPLILLGQGQNFPSGGSGGLTQVASLPATCTTGTQYQITSTGATYTCGPTNVFISNVNPEAGNLNVVFMSPNCPQPSATNCIYSPISTTEIDDGTVTNGQTTISSAGQAKWCNGSTVPCATGQPSTVGMRIWAFPTCYAGNLSTYTAIIGSATATTVASVQSATALTMSIAATGTQANTACVIVGNPDDTGQSNAETAMLAALKCPKLVYSSGNVMWTSWHLQINPNTCLRNPQVPSNSWMGGGMEVSGQGTGITQIYTDPLMATNAALTAQCTVGASSNACMLGTENGRWSNFSISGGGLSRNGLTSAHSLLNAQYSFLLDHIWLGNLGPADGALVGVLGGVQSWPGFGTYEWFCDHSVIDGWGTINAQGGTIYSTQCSYQDSNGAGTNAGASINLVTSGDGFYSGGGNLFMGNANTPTAYTRYIQTANTTVVRLTSGDQCWSNFTAVAEICYVAISGAGSSVLYASNFTVAMPIGSGLLNVGIDLSISGAKAYVRDTSFNLTATGNWVNTVAGSYVYDLGGNTIASGSLVGSGVGSWSGQGSLIPYQGITAACTGAVTANTTIYPYGNHAPNVTTTACTNVTAPTGLVMNHPYTIGYLQVFGIASGTSTGDVVTVLVNGGASTVTCTVTSNAGCSDGTHQVTGVAGDLISLKDVTANGSTINTMKFIVSAE